MDTPQTDKPTELGTLFHRLNNQLGIILANAELLDAQLDDERGESGAELHRSRAAPRASEVWRR